jgi:hypothetical protein
VGCGHVHCFVPCGVETQFGEHVTCVPGK